MTTRPDRINSFPTIITDRALGSDLADFELDTDYLHDYLAAKGLNDTQIEDLTIYFSADNAVLSGDIAKENIHYRKGRYEMVGNTIRVFVDTIATANAWLDTYKDMQQFNRMFGKEVATVLGHELEHYVANVERKFAPLEAYPTIEMKNGEWTPAAYAGYLMHPEEQRARQEASNYSPQAVSFDFDK
jgi:hypothetical protein